MHELRPSARYDCTVRQHRDDGCLYVHWTDFPNDPPQQLTSLSELRFSSLPAKRCRSVDLMPGCRVMGFKRR